MWEDEEGCKGWGYRRVMKYLKREEENKSLKEDYNEYGGKIGV